MRRSSGGLSEKNVFDLLPVCIGKLMNRPSVRGRIPGGEHQSRDERATNETGSGWPGAAYANMRWTLLKDANKLNLAQLTDLEALVSQYTTSRTARAWLYREQLREILERKQINVVSEMLQQWCTNVMFKNFRLPQVLILTVRIPRDSIRIVVGLLRGR